MNEKRQKVILMARINPLTKKKRLYKLKKKTRKMVKKTKKTHNKILRKREFFRKHWGSLISF
jgi:hypothetical protein